MGYYKGEVDGLLGPLTRKALTAYQSDQGLIATAVSTSRRSIPSEWDKVNFRCNAAERIKCLGGCLLFGDEQSRYR